MNPSVVHGPSRRAGRVLLACAALLAFSSALGGEGDADSPRAAVWRSIAGTAPPPRAGTVRSGLAAVDGAAVRNVRPDDRIAFDLLGDEITAIITRRRARTPERFTLSGPILDPEGRRSHGSVLIAYNNGAIAGLIRTAGGGSYRLRAAPGGGHALEEVDTTSLLTCGAGDAELGANLPPAGDREGDPILDPTCEDGSVIDVLVVYTPEARDEAGGDREIIAEIDLMMEDMNIAYESSLLETRMHLALAWPVRNGDTISLSAFTGQTDGQLDEVHTLRDLFGADQVALVKSGASGIANGLRDLDPESEAEMFCLCGIGAAPVFIIAHEIGHNMGCCHALGDGGGCGQGLLFDFSNGTRFVGDSGTEWRTLMAYFPGEGIRHYSSPEILFDGHPTGIADVADNARTIRASALTVANFRCRDDSPCSGLTGPGMRTDCNRNGLPDACDIALGSSTDIDLDGIPDDCEDCNGNGFPDDLEIATGAADDCNANLVPDDCEVTPAFAVRSADLSPIHRLSPQRVVIADPPLATDDVVFTVTASADLDGMYEFINIALNGIWQGNVFRDVARHCPMTPEVDLLTVPRDDYNAAIAGAEDLFVDLYTTLLVLPEDCPEGSFVRLEISCPREPLNDANGNGVPDDCECPGDIDGSGAVDGVDMVAVLAGWGPCDEACPEDVDGNGAVDWLDLVEVMAHWGGCP